MSCRSFCGDGGVSSSFFIGHCRVWTDFVSGQDGEDDDFGK